MQTTDAIDVSTQDEALAKTLPLWELNDKELAARLEHCTAGGLNQC